MHRYAAGWGLDILSRTICTISVLAFSSVHVFVYSSVSHYRALLDQSKLVCTHFVCVILVHCFPYQLTGTQVRFSVTESGLEGDTATAQA